MSYQMTNEELAKAIVSYYERAGNPWLTSASVHAEHFAEQDKVRFQLVFSNLYLKPPHTMVKRDNPVGRGAVWRLRTKDDPAFVAPVKIPRKTKVTEVEQPLAAVAPEPVVSRIQHRTNGMVAETPAAVRKHEADTQHIEHRKLGAPPNNAMAEALAKIRPQVAAFPKAAPYEVPPFVEVKTIPVGVHAPIRAKGEAPLPSMVMAGVAETTKAAFSEMPAISQSEAARIVLGRGTEYDMAEEREPAPDLINPQLGTAAQLFQSMLALAVPALKNLIRDAMIEALTHDDVAAILTPPPAEITVSREPSMAEKFQAMARNIAIEPKEEPRQKPPKVCVIGLPKPSHEQILKREFGDKLDVVTVSTDARPPTIVGACRNADYVVLLAKHSNHSVTHVLNSAHIEFDRIQGGIQKASDYLRDVVALHK